jgi:quercetin dioxygenase-like cupin family protein
VNREDNDLIADYLLGTLPAQAAPASVLARLQATLNGVDRFAPFMDDLTRLFDLSRETVRRLLARVDGQGPAWDTDLLGVRLAGAELFHFPVGPVLRGAGDGAAGGVLRVRAGASFPQHRHTGDEVTYVLEGGYCAGGQIYGPGSMIEMKGGSAHDYQAAPERDLVIMVLHHGISFA